MTYRNCKWCHGKGCLYCESERQKDIEQVQEPIFIAQADNPHDMELLKQAFGREAIEQAWKEAQNAYNPYEEFNRLIRIKGIIASMQQLAHKENKSEEQG